MYQLIHILDFFIFLLESLIRKLEKTCDFKQKKMSKKDRPLLVLIDKNMKTNYALSCLLFSD